MKVRTLILPALAVLVLTACGGEPSSADIKTAYTRLADTQMKGFSSFVGEDMAKLAETKIHDVKKIACKSASDKPGYVCDFKVDAESMLGRSEQLVSARFVKGDEGWEVIP